MPTLITAGDGSNGAVITSASDNSLTIQTGAAGAKVNAIALASDGGATFIKTTGGILTLGTSQPTTSGTSIDITGIPSWAKRVTLMFNGVSTNGASNFQLQLGAGSVQTSGYAGYAQTFNGSTLSNTGTVTTGFPLFTAAATDSKNGTVVFTLFGSNTWVANGFVVCSAGAASSTTGTVTLSGALDRIRITSNGTDTFDAGSVNILYEG